MDDHDVVTEERCGDSDTARAGRRAPSRRRVFEALKQVYDPELGINIVDLGLVYEVERAPGGDVDIRYSLTTMGCPIGPLIEDQMRAFLAPIEGLGEVRPGARVPARLEPRDDVGRGQGRARDLLTEPTRAGARTSPEHLPVHG